MNICQITSAHELQSERIFKRCCKGLARRGHRVTYIAPHTRTEVLDEIRILPVTPRSGLNRRLFSTAEAFRIARGLDADIYHYHDPELHPFMDLLARGGRKVVFDMHENYAGVMRNRVKGMRRAMIPVYAAYERYILKRVHGVVFVSQSLADLFDGLAQHSCLVRNIIDTRLLEGWTPPPRETEPVLISAGRNLSHERHCDRLIEALPLIHEEFPAARVRFMGSYSQGYEEKLPALAKQLGVAEQLDMMGWVEWKDSFDELAKAWIGCVFFEDSDNNRIGLPNRVFDYLFANLPLIFSDFPELRRVAETTGAALTVNTDHPGEIAEAAKSLLRDRDRLEAMARKGREAVFNSYSYENELKNLEAMYESILAV